MDFRYKKKLDKIPIFSTSTQKTQKKLYIETDIVRAIVLHVFLCLFVLGPDKATLFSSHAAAVSCARIGRNGKITKGNDISKFPMAFAKRHVIVKFVRKGIIHTSPRGRDPTGWR